MRRLLVIWCIIFLLCQVNGKGKKEKPKKRLSKIRKEYEDKCGYYYQLELTTNETIKSPNFDNPQNYPPGIECTWTFVGSSVCTPEIFCDTFELRKNKCQDKLIISDGLGGRIKFCDKQKMTKSFRASQGARDLFVKFITGDNNKFHQNVQGFSCTVTCGTESSSTAVEIPVHKEQQKEDPTCTCGVHGQEGRVVGGKDAERNEFPWQVALVKPGTRKPFCAGSIINNKYILTAAHCFWFAKKTTEDVEVLLHAHVLDSTITSAMASQKIPLGEEGSMQGPGYNLPKATDKDEKSVRLRVKRVMNHPLFTKKYDFDVALLQLDELINFKEANVGPICLHEPGVYDQFEGEKPVVSGWGLANEKAGASTRLLQKLEVPVIPLKECQKAMPHILTDRMVCAGFLEGKRDACTGDSGGPLQLKMKNNQWKQIGIVSWGQGCARAFRPGIYSRVTEFIQWISRHSNDDDVLWCRKTYNDNENVDS